MDPLTLLFISTAVCATVFLVLAHFFIYITTTKVQTIDSTTQTRSQKCISTYTSPHVNETQTIGLQFPEKPCETIETGCDASSTCYGSIATEQIEIFRESQTHLEDLINDRYSGIELQIQRFTKDILEHTVQQYKVFKENREEIIQQHCHLQRDLTAQIQNFRGQTQENLRKVQDSLDCEVQRSTNNIVHQLLSIPPPPPLPPQRPWLYLPYGCQTRSAEAYQEWRARQNHFWALRWQANTISTDVMETPEEGEDAQYLDWGP